MKLAREKRIPGSVQLVYQENNLTAVRETLEQQKAALAGTRGQIPCLLAAELFTRRNSRMLSVRFNFKLGDRSADRRCL